MTIRFFDNLLQQLHVDSDEIKASAIMSSDGIMLASKLPLQAGEDRAAAMSAAVLSVSDRMIEDLTGGVTDRVMIQSATGYVIVSAVSAELLLTVVAKPDAKLGMVFHDIKKLTERVNSQTLELAL